MDTGRRELRKMEIKAKIINNNLEKDIVVSSDLIDTIYEIIKQTYLEAKEIHIKNPTNADNKELSDFLTYILAYPKGIETPKVIVSEDHINSNNSYYDEFAERTLVCFSGGVDSTGALLKLLDEEKNPVAFWCDYGQPYKEPERKAVERICKKLNIPLIEAVLDLTDLIAVGGKKFGHVFPARNLMIASIGLCFKPKEIVLAGLCDELVVPDKSLRMYEEFIKYFEVPLYSPFVNMTKTEVLCVWKAKWDKYLNAKETVSCYSNNGDCQNCSSCAKREVAFVASDYTNQYPEVFTNQHELIEGHWFSRVDIFQYERRTDMLIALSKYKEKLTPKLQKLVSYNCQKYRDEITKRKTQLNMLKEIK